MIAHALMCCVQAPYPMWTNEKKRITSSNSRLIGPFEVAIIVNVHALALVVPVCSGCEILAHPAFCRDFVIHFEYSQS